MSLTSAPLSGVNVFLHVRDAVSSSQDAEPKERASAIRKRCKTLVEELGAALTISVTAADMVIFHNGSDTLLENSVAEGKEVVRPSYLIACAQAGKRVASSSYRIGTTEEASSGSLVKKKTQKSSSVPALSAAAATTTPIRSPARHKRGAMSPVSSSAGSGGKRTSNGDAKSKASAPPVTAVVPYLNLDDEDDEDTNPMPVTPPLSNSQIEVSSEKRQAPRSRGSKKQEKAAVDCSPFSDDEIRHAVLRSTAQPGRRGGAKSTRDDESASSEVRGEKRSSSAAGTATGAAVKVKKEGIGVSPRCKRRRVDPFISADTSPRLSGISNSSAVVTQEGDAEDAQEEEQSSSGLVDTTQKLSQAALFASTPRARGGRSSGSKVASSAKSPRTVKEEGEKKKVVDSEKRKRGRPPSPGKARKTVLIEDTPLAKIPSTVITPSPSKRKTTTSTTSRRNTTETPDRGAEATQLPTMCFTEQEKLQVMPADISPASLRIAIAIEDYATAQLLADVVEQLGATSIAPGSSYYGRKKKPTHVVVGPDAELTPNILLAKVLGVCIVTPQWLHDAIAIGAFPCVIPEIHSHPLFGVERQEYGEGETKEGVAPSSLPAMLGIPHTLSQGLPDCLDSNSNSDANMSSNAVGGCSKGHSAGVTESAELAFLSKGVAEEMVPAGQQWERPYYRPVFQGKVFYLFVSDDALGAKGGKRKTEGTTDGLEDPLTALEQASELIRTLGGSVTRTLRSVRLDAVIDLAGFYLSPDTTATAEAKATRRKKSTSDAVTADIVPPPPESLTIAYQLALECVESYHTQTGAAPSPLPIQQRNSGERNEEVARKHTESTAEPTKLAIPVLGIAWLVYSILSRHVASMEPFTLRTIADVLEFQGSSSSTAGSGSNTKPMTTPVPPRRVPCKTTTIPRVERKSPPTSPVSVLKTLKAGPPPAQAPITGATSSPPLKNRKVVAEQQAAAAATTTRTVSATARILEVGVAAARTKTKAGPRSAQKQAGDQPNTQQIHDVLADGAASILSSDASLPSSPSLSEVNNVFRRDPFALDLDGGGGWSKSDEDSDVEAGTSLSSCDSSFEYTEDDDEVEYSD